MAMKTSKRVIEARGQVEAEKLYAPLEAMRLLKNLPPAKFDETVEAHFRLGVDPRKADQMIRGTTMLPHGTGKEMRVCVFAEGDKDKEARDAGADVVGSCLLYTSDAADDLLCVDLGGR